MRRFGQNKKLNFYYLIIGLLGVLFLGCNNQDKTPISPFSDSTLSLETKAALKQIDEKGEEDIDLTVPHLNYCKGLGYEIAKDDQCVFKQGESCPAWDFLKGQCHNELTFCQKNGFVLKTVEDKFDNEKFTYGVCVFKDNSECEEYQYFLGNCQPGQCSKYKLSEGGCIKK